MQATMGALSRVRVHYVDLVQALSRVDAPIYVTALDGDNINKCSLTKNGVIVMGNEGNGISPAIRKKITHKLLIPNFNTNPKGADSLNVAIATAITLSEIKGHQPIEQSYNTNN